LGVSAYLSLFVPALFFAASYTPLTAAFERRLPFSPAGWLIVLLATALTIYGAMAIASTEVIAELPFGVRPYSTAMGLTTIALLLFSAWRQAAAYLVARLPLQGILVLPFVLLAEAQGIMTLARSGLLHDVGKIGIPDAILNKPGPLDADEWIAIKRHPHLGHEILLRVPSLHREAEIVIAHHERIDGSGYPRGLRGEQIPLEARILAVADTYDVLISNRPYRQAFDSERAVRILREESGT